MIPYISNEDSLVSVAGTELLTKDVQLTLLGLTIICVAISLIMYLFMKYHNRVCREEYKIWNSNAIYIGLMESFMYIGIFWSVLFAGCCIYDYIVMY